MRTIITIILCSSHFAAAAQTTEWVFRSKGDSTQNYYLALQPATPSRGLLLIIGGFCSTPISVMQETKLPETAVRAGYTVVIPTLYNCDSIRSNSIAQQRLETLIPELIAKYKIPANHLIIGGQSMGGHQALYYAGQALKPDHKPGLIAPNLVFGVDPPLNMKRLWNSFQYTIRMNFSAIAMGEALEQTRRFRLLYGGSPDKFPKAYEAASSFYADAPDGGNARHLRSIPVRLYCDPDISWIISNRRGTAEFMNMADLSGCISQLLKLGNTRAEFVNCLGKGFKPDGSRHPHFFSMLDPDEFVQWMERMLGNK